MPKVMHGAWNGDLRESHDLRGYAYEDGSRASWHDGGYSAEKSACSFCYSKTFGTGAQPFTNV